MQDIMVCVCVWGGGGGASVFSENNIYVILVCLKTIVHISFKFFIFCGILKFLKYSIFENLNFPQCISHLFSM